MKETVPPLTIIQSYLCTEEHRTRGQVPGSLSVSPDLLPLLRCIGQGADQCLPAAADFLTAYLAILCQTIVFFTFLCTGSHALGGTQAGANGLGPDGWHQNALPMDRSPVDFSFLNRSDRPAGRRGFVRAQGEQLLFGDGTSARFWGANLQGAALFTTSDDQIKIHARRIAQLGFNLVRIHHHDSAWVTPNIFINPARDTRILSAESLRKLDLWIASLKQQGVYIWVDLQVGRNFTRHDGIAGFDDFAKGKPASEARGFSYFNSDLQARMQEFNRAYLNHVNRYTGIAYKDEPALLALLLTNENDLTHHFGNALLPDKGAPLHARRMAEDAARFATRHRLPYKKLLRTWDPGLSKIYLNDVEHRFNQIMITDLHQLGVRSLIATTNFWGGMGLSSLPALTDGGIIDVHAYGTAGELYRDPRRDPTFLSWIGAAQVAGKPLSVTEWNLEPFPTADRFLAPLFLAGIASLQGWDALMLYGYAQKPMQGPVPGSNYSALNDPAIMGLMPAAALLFRQGHVARSRNEYELTPDRTALFFEGHDPARSSTIRTLLETSRFCVRMPKVPELPWLQTGSVNEKAIVMRDMQQDLIPAGQSFVLSDTGELRRDWVKGIQTVNTTRSQIAAGAIGGETIQLANVNFAIRTRQAVVAVQSLDDRPILTSRRILITLIARALPDPANKATMLSEPVSGVLSFGASRGLKLYKPGKSGNRQHSIPVQYLNGRYTINLNATAGHWLIMR